MPPRSDRKLFLGILALFLLVVAAASVPQWLEQRRLEAAAVQEVNYPRDLLFGMMRHARGPADAEFALVEFGDFCCPNCARVAPVIEGTLKRHPRDLRHIFRHYPLTEQHDSAFTAAITAEAAGEQGRFWEMYALLFATPGEKTTEQLHDMGVRVGLNLPRASKTARDGATRAYIRNDQQDAERMLVHVTPTFFFVTPTHTYRIISGEYLEAFLDDPAHWR